jgi:death-on-curing protein
VSPLPREPRWLSRRLIEAIHRDLIRQHGGAPDLRDSNLLEAALARPLRRWEYDSDADLPGLGASYAFGLARDHPFVDGNKRVALAALFTFLDLNDVDLEVGERAAVETILALAAGELEEATLAAWARAACRARGAVGSRRPRAAKGARR